VGTDPNLRAKIPNFEFTGKNTAIFAFLRPDRVRRRTEKAHLTGITCRKSHEKEQRSCAENAAIAGAVCTDLERRIGPGKSLAKKPELQGDVNTSPIGAFHLLIATYIRSTL
jgi:hypothetical protein